MDFPSLEAEQAAAIRTARRVSNPAVIRRERSRYLRARWSMPAWCRPICRSTINAVSGYSGGGRSVIEAYEAGRAPAFELYGLDSRA